MMTESYVIAAVGEILVEFISHRPNCGLTEIGEYSGPYPSGAPAIFLDQAARMGAATEMIGGVGRDGFGETCTRRLAEDGVGIGGIARSPDRTTGVAFVSYYDDGRRDFIYHLGGTAADRFEMPAGLLDPSRTILHVSAASLGNAAMRSTILAFLREVEEAGGRISCDPNARPELMRDPSARDALAEVMDRSWCLLPSTSDLAFLHPDLSEAAAIDRMLATRAEIVALKRGAAGVTIAAGGERTEIAGHPVIEIDPTGAGDCFCGTFVALLSQGMDPVEAGIQANAAGAIAVTHRGPMEGNSGPNEIAAFLRGKGTKP